jgi:type IV pilus assembly protein PilM
MSLSFFGKKSVVGVDLGHSTIRIVEIERSSLGWVLSKAVKFPMPDSSVRDGVIFDPEGVGNAIRTAMSKAHISASSAHVAVAGASVIVRTVRIPQMTESSLRKSIKIEAGRYVPSSVDDSYIEFEVIGKADDQQMDVLIVAAPKEVVESRIAAVKHAGLTVESVDVEVFASYRSLVEADENGGWKEKTLAMVDVGSFCTTVSVVQQGVFTMTRSISQGGQLLTDALMNYFRMSDAEAENGKAQLDISLLVDEATPKENPPLRVVQPHIDDLIREIRRSLNYFQSQQTEVDQNKTVEAILITGGGAKLPGLAEYMAHKLGIPTIAAGVFDNPRFTHSGQEDWGTGAELSIATGLAMRSFVKAEKLKVA